MVYHIEVCVYFIGTYFPKIDLIIVCFRANMYTTKGEHPKKNSKEENEMENYNYSIFTNEEVAEFLTWAETEDEKEAISYLLYHYEEEIEKVELLDNFDFKGTKEWDEWMLKGAYRKETKEFYRNELKQLQIVYNIFFKKN